MEPKLRKRRIIEEEFFDGEIEGVEDVDGDRDLGDDDTLEGDVADPTEGTP